jgi:hypothetical protein
MQQVTAIEKNGSLPIHAAIVSRTPGRIRLRIARLHRQHHKIEPITKALKERLEIDRVKTNLKNGSIIVYHERDRSSFDDIEAVLKDLGIVFLEITESATIPTGKSQAATEVSNAVFDLNKRVKKATNGAVDLRFLLPLSFSALAVRQLLIKGLQLEIIPWYVLAWYAFDSFIKLHYTSDPESNNS